MGADRAKTNQTLEWRGVIGYKWNELGDMSYLYLQKQPLLDKSHKLTIVH